MSELRDAIIDFVDKVPWEDRDSIDGLRRALAKPSEMQQLAEWLRQQAEQEGNVMRNIAMCDRDDRRTAAGIRAGYMATLNHIRTKFLGEGK